MSVKAVKPQCARCSPDSLAVRVGTTDIFPGFPLTFRTGSFSVCGQDLRQPTFRSGERRAGHHPGEWAQSSVAAVYYQSPGANRTA